MSSSLKKEVVCSSSLQCSEHLCDSAHMMALDLLTGQSLESDLRSSEPGVGLAASFWCF